jgi:hypothetical protein
MKLSSRLVSFISKRKPLKTTLAITASLLATAMGGIQAKAADMYGFPNLNGKTVYLELANGQRVQLPLARAVNGNKVNSFTADNTDDWKWKVVDDGFGVSFLRVNTNQAFSVENLNVVDRTPIVSWDYQGHGRYLDWNPQAVGGGYYLIRLRHNLNQCLNIPGGANNAWVTTWTCNANDPDQRFKIVEVSQVQTERYQTVVENEKFVFVVASLRPKIGSSVAPTGHAFTSLIRSWDNYQYKYVNNQFVSKSKIDSQLFYDTMSAAGESYPLPLINGANPDKSFSWERDKILRWLNESKPSRIYDGDRIFSFISGEISKDSYYNYLPTNLGGKGYRVGSCTKYATFPSTPDSTGTDCNCSTYASKFWNTLNPVFLGNTSVNLSSQSLLGPNHPLILSKIIDKIFGWSDWNRNF